MGKKRRQQQQKRTKQNVTDPQQPKEVALAPKVPVERATNKNVTEQQEPNDPTEEVPTTSLSQGHTTENRNNNEEEVLGTSTQRKPTEPRLEVTEASKEEVRPPTLSATNPFSKFSFGTTAKAAAENETPPHIFGTPYFGPQTTRPFSSRATDSAGNTNTTEPPKFSFGATATAKKKNNNQGEEKVVTDTNTNTVEKTYPTQSKEVNKVPHELLLAPFSTGIPTTDRKPAGKKSAVTKNPKKQQTNRDLGVGVAKAEQRQATDREIIKAIQGAISTMPTINMGRATNEEQMEVVHRLRAALSNKNLIEVPPTTNNLIEVAKNHIEVLTMSHCSHERDDELINMVTTILSSSKDAGACDICSPNAKKEVVTGPHVKENVMWVCLQCAKHFCAREDGKPQGHARRHAIENGHWLATRFLDPRAGYCFSCEQDVSVEGNDVVEVDNKTTLEVEEAVDPKETSRPQADQMEDNEGSGKIEGTKV